VLISSSTRELVADELPSDVALRDLGEHRLKDLDRPEHLFQLVVGDLRADFPALASLSSGSGGANGLPPAPNRTIGREEHVRAIVDRLRVDGVRLLTLTGPGGVGKTRLGLEAARAVEAEFADGAYFVSLAALQRPEDVPAAIVSALAIVVLSGESADQAAERFLAAKHLLLVVDNFEHLLAGAPFIGRLLEICPALTVLATSREPLGLHAEERYPVSPLALPAQSTPKDANTLAGVDAVALFCARARARDPGFDLDDANAPAVAEICRRVDGLPLAIELAAARCGLLSPDEVAGRLRETLSALGCGTRDAPARQQTLHATIDWSHELLSDAEKQCFARFAVFAGGATVQAAETIMHAGLDTLDGLVAKSLLRRDDAHRSTRLSALATIRSYAGERFIAAADADGVRERHCRYYLALAQREATERALWGAQQSEHLARLDPQGLNLDAALQWAVARNNSELSLGLARWLGEYWHVRNRFAHAVESIDKALGTGCADGHPELRARALLAKLPCLWPLATRSEGSGALDEAAALARELGDPALISRVLYWRSRREANDADFAAAAAHADDALRWATKAGDDWEIAMVSSAKALATPTFAQRRELIDQAASRLTAVGNHFELVPLFTNAAYSALCEGNAPDAKALLGRAAPLVRAFDHPEARMVFLGNVGVAALLTGDSGSARRAFRDELKLCRELAFRPIAQEGLLGLAAVATGEGATFTGPQCLSVPQLQIATATERTPCKPS
jgi:predicted ATPase